jgi:membrane-bound serine protease (ClpP class)
MTDYLTLSFLLFGLGIVLFVAEYFLPTGGFLIVAGLLLCVVGVGVVAYFGTVTETVAAMIVLCIGVPLGGTALMYAMGRRMALRAEADDDTSGAAVLPVPSDLDTLKGRIGRTISTMRPSGTVDFDGRRVDAMTEGVMLEADVWVKCVDVKAGKVIVRQVPKPRDLAEFDIDDLK